MTISAITTPLNNTEDVGTPFFDIFASIPGITRCLAIAKIALDPPRMDAITTDAVANSAEIEMNFRMKILFVASLNAI